MCVTELLKGWTEFDEIFCVSSGGIKNDLRIGPRRWRCHLTTSVGSASRYIFMAMKTIDCVGHIKFSERFFDNVIPKGKA